MTRHVLTSEKLTVLPKRFETRRAGNTNIAFVGQSNWNLQAVGFGVLVKQNSEQANIAVISQR